LVSIIESNPIERMNDEQKHKYLPLAINRMSAQGGLLSRDNKWMLGIGSEKETIEDFESNE